MIAALKIYLGDRLRQPRPQVIGSQEDKRCLTCRERQLAGTACQPVLHCVT